MPSFHNLLQLWAVCSVGFGWWGILVEIQLAAHIKSVGQVVMVTISWQKQVCGCLLLLAGVGTSLQPQLE